jgi:uncharacterized Zn-binding protein involved in type VI secretion
MSPVARMTDIHTCPMCDGAKPHVGGAILDGTPTVRVGGLPVATVGSACSCLSPKTATIITGSGNVRVCGKPAVRQGDSTDHAGTVRTGFLTVRVG